VIVFGRADTEIAKWLCSRIEVAPTRNLRCIGHVNADGKTIGVVGYDNWTGTSAQVHLAGEGIWLTREFLYHAFNFVFGQEKLNLIIAVISSGNKQSLRFTKHMGFTELTRIVGAHPEGDLVVLELRRENCRFLEKVDGQTNSRCA
jgi:RimJ/RimL family protein N-acetyltransferase